MLDNFKISQSSFKAFYTPNLCPMAWHKKYVLRQRDEQIPSDAQLMGQVFEYKCIGATVSGQVPMLPKINVKNLKPTRSANKPDMIAYLESKGVDPGLPATKDELFEKIEQLPDEFSEGEPGQAEREIDECVELYKRTQDHEGIRDIEIQEYLETDELCGTWDRKTEQNGKLQLRDLKFASTKFENEYYNGWSQPVDEAFNRRYLRGNGYLEGFILAPDLEDRIKYMQSLTFYERSIIQAVHYLIIYYENHGTWPQFFFDIYGKSGWQRIRQIIIDVDEVETHYEAMEIFKADLEELFAEGPHYNPSYATCRGCDYFEKCKVREEYPEIEQTNFLLIER